MKRITLSLIALICLIQSSAFAQGKAMYSCSDIYTMELSNKLEKRDKYNNNWNRTHGDLSYNNVVQFMGFMSLALNAPVGLTLLLGPVVISEIKNLPSRAERVARLQDETFGLHNRFVNRLQKEVSSEITSEEVIDMIQAHFDSGKLCDKLPKLYSPRQIKKLVTEKLESKYLQ